MENCFCSYRIAIDQGVVRKGQEVEAMLGMGSRSAFEIAGQVLLCEWTGWQGFQGIVLF